MPLQRLTSPEGRALRKESARSLVGERIRVWGASAAAAGPDDMADAAAAPAARVGLVVDVKAARGAKSRHLVLFEDAGSAHGGFAPAEELLLQKEAGGKGCRFVVLEPTLAAAAAEAAAANAPAAAKDSPFYELALQQLYELSDIDKVSDWLQYDACYNSGTDKLVAAGMRAEDACTLRIQIEQELGWDMFGDTPLKAAARDGDVAEVARLLATAGKPPPGAPERDGAFLAACRYLRAGVVALPQLADCVRRCWASADGEAAWNYIFLHTSPAAREPRLHMVEAMLLLAEAQKLDVDASTWSTMSVAPIISAAASGDERLVELCIAHGSDPGSDYWSPDFKDCGTPLSTACKLGHVPTIELLLAHPRVNVNKVSLHGGKKTALRTVAGMDKADVRRLQQKTSPGSSALATAEYGEPADVVRLLLKYGADPNTADSMDGEPSGATPLNVAAVNGDEQVIELLLKAPGVDIMRGQCDTSQKNALHTAASNGNGATVTRLLQACPQLLNTVSPSGGSSLVQAVCTGHNAGWEERHRDVVRRLIDAGADVNLTPTAFACEGWTPLHALCVLGSGLWAVELLLNTGAHINAEDATGATPLDFADGLFRRNGDASFAKALRTAGGLNGTSQQA